MKPKAVILLSGGLDSTTCLALAKQQGFSCYTLNIDYGQKHHVEIKAAEKIAGSLGVEEHRTVAISLGELWGRSALTHTDLAVPDYVDGQDIPITYVPARNTIFLSLALGWAEALGAYDIFIGANAIDYSNYPDCRPVFIRAFEELANLATKAGKEEGQKFHIHAPLLNLNKAEIIQAGIALGIDYSQTISCYRADEQGNACGTCDSCIFRKKGFKEAGVVDPTCYKGDSAALSL